jgi:crossover junction endodeoxyribonuclease RuvC
MSTILGIDPSLSSTGFFLFDDEEFEIIDYGYISTDDLEEDKAMLKIHKILSSILDKYDIDKIGIEQEFYSRNVKTLRKLSHVHGVALLLFAQYEIPYTYYSVMTLKSKVLNGMKRKKEDGTKKSGDEIKQEVAEKIFEVFGRTNFIKEFTDDVTDAASAALTYYLMDGMSTDEYNSNKYKHDKEVLAKNQKEIHGIIDKEIYNIEE